MAADYIRELFILLPPAPASDVGQRGSSLVCLGVLHRVQLRQGSFAHHDFTEQALGWDPGMKW